MTIHHEEVGTVGTDWGRISINVYAVVPSVPIVPSKRERERVTRAAGVGHSIVFLAHP